MKMTGQILKEHRERKGISLNEVALATKINIKTLVAMEEGESDKLPTKTFLRGFVRSYARYLGIDEDHVLNTFFEEMGSTKPKLIVGTDGETSPPSEPNIEIEVKAPPRIDSKPKVSSPPIDPSQTSAATKIWAAFGIIILVILIVIFKNKMDSYQNEAVISEIPKEIEAVNPDEQAATAPTPASEKLTEESAKASPSPSASPGQSSAVVAATPESSPTPSQGAVSSATPAPTPSPAASASPTATPKPSPSPSPSPTPKSSLSPSPSPTPKASPSASPSPSPSPALTGRVQEVLIEALDNVEIDAQVDNEPSRKIKLRADQIQSFKAKRKVKLKLSDGGAVSLVVNGIDRGVPGDLGKPFQVDLP